MEADAEVTLSDRRFCTWGTSTDENELGGLAPS